MADISALFWDVGGVLLTNGWDRASRRRAAEEFDLGWDEFQERHDLVVIDFETGRISLDEYLRCTVFHRDRSFTADAFKDFMFAQSKPHAATLAIVERLAQDGKYLLATLNNESLELNLYRIEKFSLRDHFDLFLSSSFLGVMKPEEAIYRLALHVTQRDPANCVFIDDRELNLECAAREGLRTIHYQNPEQLRHDLRELGIELR